MDFLRSAVSSAVSRGPLAAYSLQERVDLDGSIWMLNNAIKKDGNTRCTIFTFEVNANKSRLPIAKNAVRKARTLHHPGVIKVIETIDTDTHIYIITERVMPLAWFTKRKVLSEETRKWGLWNVAKTIKFINDEAASVHGCVRTSSILVGDTGEWKVGGFDLLSSVKEDDAVIYLYSSLIPDSGRFSPPEVAKGGWDAIRRNPIAAVDSYGYGVLAYETFNGAFPGAEQALQTRDLPPSIHMAYKRLMNPNPKMRLSVAHFLEQGQRSGGFFQTPLINLSEQLESLGLKSEGEREEFLLELNEVADQYPEDYLKRKILPELLKSVEFGGGGAKVFSVVLKIGAKLSSDEYESVLTPVLVRLFASPDRAIRVCLLENLPLMIDHLSPKLVNDKVFPNMTTGFTDQAPLVREQTVKSVLVVIGKLSERTVNGELLKYMAKTSNDAEPGIRTNTIICLGKIGRQLSQSTRSKVLIAAFTRSLRDPFVHARNAALLALAATADLFTDADCANTISPAICPTLLDKEKMVRDQANKTLNIYLGRVRKAADSVPIQDPASRSEPASQRQSRTATPQPTAEPASWTGWAFNSIANKAVGMPGDLRPDTPQANGSIQPTPISTSGTPSFEDPPSPLIGSQNIKPLPTTIDTFDDNGWGEDTGDAWGSPSEEQPAATGSTTASNSGGDSGEPDFAAWLAAKQTNSKALPKAGLPKGLGSKTTTKTSNGSIARPAVIRNASSNSNATRRVIAPASTPKAAPAAKATPAKKVEKEVEDDDWGAAWD